MPKTWFNVAWKEKKIDDRACGHAVLTESSNKFNSILKEIEKNREEQDFLCKRKNN